MQAAKTLARRLKFKRGTKMGVSVKEVCSPVAVSDTVCMLIVMFIGVFVFLKNSYVADSFVNFCSIFLLTQFFSSNLLVILYRWRYYSFTHFINLTILWIHYVNISASKYHLVSCTKCYLFYRHVFMSHPIIFHYTLFSSHIKCIYMLS